MLGAEVCSFARHFGQVARATGAAGGPPLSLVQRRRLAREAVSRAPLKRLARSARRPGFAAALEELISELQAASIDPETFRARASEAGASEVELASLYQAYDEIRRELGTQDAYSVAAEATAGLRANPDAWSARPVFLYGFDDLTVEQLELVRALLSACEVTIALPYEDRAVLTAARGSLFAQLRDVGGVDITHLEADPTNTASRTLFELERRFGDENGEAAAIDNDGGLSLIASAGSWPRRRRSAPRWLACCTRECRPARSRSSCATRARPGRCFAGCSPASASRSRCRRTWTSPRL